ncbi:AraC-like DNA-binding protein [Rhizobium pisi]
MSQVDWKNSHQLSLVGTNPQELSTALAHLLPATTVVPEGKGEIKYEIYIFREAAASVIASNYEGDLTLQFPGRADTKMVLIPLAGSAVVTVGDRPMLSVGTRGIIAGGSLQIRMAGARKHLCLRIPSRELIRRLAVRLNAPIKRSLDFAPEIDLSLGSGPNLLRLANIMHNGLVDGTLPKSPIAFGNLSAAIIELLIDAASHDYSHEISGGAKPPLPRHVKRAIDYMHTNISRMITVDEIARSCGVSERTLQEGFRKFRMTTPTAYLLHLRLEAAREEFSLGDPGASVSAVALKWGFAHMGRFSAQYREHFGELPSHTLCKIGGNTMLAARLGATDFATENFLQTRDPAHNEPDLNSIIAEFDVGIGMRKNDHAPEDYSMDGVKANSANGKVNEI